MRLSPFLLAALAASVTVSFQSRANGQIIADPDRAVTTAQAVEAVPDSPDAPPADLTPTDTSPTENDDGAPVPTETPTEALPSIEEPTEEPTADTQPTDPRVLVAEVLVRGAEQDLFLEEQVYEAIRTRPGRTTTRSNLQEDINAVFATGFFSNVRALPEDTPLGVRVVFAVQPNPVLSQVRLNENLVEALSYRDEPNVPTDDVIEDIFSGQYGEILNLRRLDRGIQDLNQVYRDNGYTLAQVIDIPQISDDGVVTLDIAEGVIEDIQVQFLSDEGLPTDEDGEPVDGKTRNFIITREFESQSGDVFNQGAIEQDLQRVFALGLFEDVRLSLNPGDNPRKVDVIVNVIERNTGSIAAGAGFSSASGLFGTVSYQEDNLGGNNQDLRAEVQVGQRDLLFNISFTDPWIAGDPFKTSYTVNAFSRRSISLVFDGGETDVDLANGDSPRIQRLGAGFSFSRPLGGGWTASLGPRYQRVSVTDDDGDVFATDSQGNPLSFSGSGQDDLFTVQFGAVQDRRNSALSPTKGSLLRLGTEQSIPLGSGSIFFNRLRASYSRYFPVRFTNFTQGCREEDASPIDCPQALAFNIQGGTVIGDLPPYEAFSLGGTDSVRGFDAGDVGSGRSYVLATAEYRFPVFSFIGGALFVDYGTDLGTGDNVLGNPAGVRGKPGSGFGYGLGVRVQTPLGPIRVDYAINDDGDNRIHFGIGERF